MKTKAFRKFFGTLSVLALALGAGVAIRSVSAGTETGSGWLWGGMDTDNLPNVFGQPFTGDENGFGWISVNSKDCDTDGNGTIDVPACGTVGSAIASYGVNIPESGALSGYGWSEHYGWISFNGTAPTNDLAGCSPALTQATRTGNVVSGGARVLSIKDAVAANNAGGFDGCISLSGTATDGSPYGVTVSGTSLAGFAWSSDLGWLDFSRSSYVQPSVLTVCREGVALSGPGLNFPMSRNSSTTLKAYFDSTVDCTGTDVTTLASWSDTASSAVTLSADGTDPRTATAGSSTGSDTVTVTHGGQTVTMNISVICVETTTCDSATSGVCSGDTVPTGTTVAGVCGPVSCGGTAGTRYCDFNWKEVTPGQ